MITTHCNKSYVKLVVSLSISLYCRYFQTVVDPGVTETMETTARDEGVTANWASPATSGLLPSAAPRTPWIISHLSGGAEGHGKISKIMGK